MTVYTYLRFFHSDYFSKISNFKIGSPSFHHSNTIFLTVIQNLGILSLGSEFGSLLLTMSKHSIVLLQLYYYIIVSSLIR